LLWNPGEGTYDGALFGPGSKTNEQLNGRMFVGPIVNGRYQPTVQVALFALYCGIVPSARLDPVRKWILAHLEEVKGPMSHYYLFDALYRMQEEDRDKEAIERIRAGWKKQVDSQWQTAWEDLSETGGSKVHMYGIVPGYFLTSYVLGARRLGPASNRSLLIEPRCSGLSWARGVAVTEFGPVEMMWSKSGVGVVSIECSIPPQISATLRLYRIDGKDVISVDQHKLDAEAKGNFIEVQLKQGKHEISYPG
jgi:hypothetical protein